MSDDDRITLADGSEVPRVAVEALAALDAKWPGTTLAQARPAIVAAVLAALRGDGIEVADGEALRERLADEIETTLTAHEPRNNDSHCTCGVRNNMDGDVLHSHRMTQIDAAIRQALENR